MKILGINGSPRTDGNTYKILRIALKGAEEEADIELINLAEYEIKPCIGCLCVDQKSCRYPCILEDDMKIIYDKVLESRGMVITTPIYWFSASGLMKNFIDRLTALENMRFIEGRSWLEGKVAGILAVGNDGGEVSTISTLMAALSSMGFVFPPFSFTYYIGSDVLSDEDALLEAVNVGRNVALMCKLTSGSGPWFNTELKRVVKEPKL